MKKGENMLIVATIFAAATITTALIVLTVIEGTVTQTLTNLITALD